MKYSGPLIYVATISAYKVTIVEGKPSMNVFSIPLMRDHPSNNATFSIPQGWPYRMGTTVIVFVPCSITGQ